MLPFATILALVLLSTLFGLYFIRTESETFRKRAARHVTTRQSSHSKPTPRVGGLAIAVGILSGALLSGSDIFGLLLWTALPIFIIGLVEDLGPDTPPALRLTVAFLSATLAAFVTGAHLTSLDTPGVDALLSIGAVGLGFTLLASAGMTHAMNLIDGLNGLSSAVVIVAMAGMGWVAHRFGHTDLVYLNVVVLTAFLGFFLVNFPRGYIFLGDAGAYSVGHIIAWNAIILLVREPSISAWSVLLIVFWPIFDVIMSTLRRVAKRAPVTRPDRMHFHHLLMRSVMILSNGAVSKEAANPLGSALAIPMIIAAAMLGVTFIDNTPAAMSSVGCLAALYWLTYVVLIKIARARRLYRRRIAA